jgi:hypothetical protein
MGQEQRGERNAAQAVAGGKGQCQRGAAPATSSTWCMTRAEKSAELNAQSGETKATNRTNRQEA